MQREKLLGLELRRKAIHLLALVIPWGMLQVEKTAGLLVLGLIATLFLGVDLGRAYVPALAGLVNKLGGAFMRQEENPGSKCKVVINGSTWVLISAFCVLLLFPAQIASLALAIFLLGDAASGLVGRRFGRISWRISKRTVEGSLAFLTASMLVVYFWPTEIQIWIIAAAVFIACAVEILPGPLNDNLQVPLAAAGVMYLLQQLPIAG
jgi:dolichol kinase